MKKIRTAEREKRILDEEQEMAILDVSKGTEFELLIETGLKTGLRLGELVHLEWTDLDMKRGVLTVKNKPGVFETKSYMNRTVPLHPDLVKKLKKAHERSASNLVFPSRAGTVRDAQNLLKSVKKIYDDAGIKDTAGLGIHTWRHTCITRLLLGGMAVPTVRAWAGHRNIQTTLGYLHTSGEDVLKAAKELWSK